MATLQFELVAPERILFSGDVEAVMLPGTEGDMTVLPGHAPVMAMLKTGFVQITDHENKGRRVLIRGGFAEINQQTVTVLAERATPVEEVTPQTIDQEINELELHRDASSDFKVREAADAAIAQLEEAKQALKF
ncbi:F0F1 ATP synthase subunit epsilon [Enterovirga rhinocerotis]|uniref:ATP synthase epsilon chain n=1 Tax=Enterovirga rhinocerotis TaxID=1339210 RepID=A0A4R7C8G2_9HYPH|nr:F0F1 ATP synthase subunit epsilon [Enterovirga rhinocerotis]TDR93136.1 ATP synthase F1 subcomplex epsilon subunit [Enterovirga rhinocerotis]